MKIDEIKDIIDNKNYKSYELGYNEYYIIFSKNYNTYVSYVGVFETITYKINKFFKYFRLGIFYNDKNYVEKISTFHYNEFVKKKITINPIKLFEIVSGKDFEVFFTINEEENDKHMVDERLFYVELNSIIRKNKLSKITKNDK